MKTSTKLLIGGGVLALGYVLYSRMNVSTTTPQLINAAGGQPTPTGSGFSDNTPGAAAKRYLASLEPNSQDFLSIVSLMTDQEAIAVSQWDQAGRPAGWQIDPVLSPPLRLFQATPEHWFF